MISTAPQAQAQRQCLLVTAFFLVITAALLLVAPNALRFGFPVLATLAAAFLFARSRPLYLQFIFWLWFLSPLLRRLVDYRTEFVAVSPLLLAPFFATAISGIVLVRHIRSLSRPAAMPFAAALGGIFFGTVIGLTRYPPEAVARALINWIVPIVYAFFLYQERRHYRDFQRVIERALLWSVLVLGIYAIYQFFLLPPWDELWMRGVNNGVFGNPERLQVRVFSTMNAPVFYAAYTMAGLLMLFALRGRLRVLAAGVGFVGLALTTSRALWIGAVFGVGYLAFKLPSRDRIRVVASLLVCVVLGVGAAQLPGIHEAVTDRLRSFSNGTSDVSYNARIEGHAKAFAELAGAPLGEGMGSEDSDHFTVTNDDSLGPHDSTILEFLFSIGGPGTLVYCIGLAAALWRIFFARQRPAGLASEPFAVALRAILVAFFAQAVLNSILVGVHGFMVWTAIGILLAASELDQTTEPATAASEPAALPLPSPAQR